MEVATPKKKASANSIEELFRFEWEKLEVLSSLNVLTHFEGSRELLESFNLNK